MTSEKQLTLEELASEVEKYLKALSYCAERMRIFRHGWRALDHFMRQNSIRFYEATVGKAFIESIISGSSYSEISQLKRDIIRGANVLTEFQATGTVSPRSCGEHTNSMVRSAKSSSAILLIGNQMAWQRTLWMVIGFIYTDFSIILTPITCGRQNASTNRMYLISLTVWPSILKPPCIACYPA